MSGDQLQSFNRPTEVVATSGETFSQRLTCIIIIIRKFTA
jgi:hypothetical protein